MYLESKFRNQYLFVISHVVNFAGRKAELRFFYSSSFALVPKIQYPVKIDKKLRYLIIFLRKSDSVRSYSAILIEDQEVREDSVYLNEERKDVKMQL